MQVNNRQNVGFGAIYKSNSGAAEFLEQAAEEGKVATIRTVKGVQLIGTEMDAHLLNMLAGEQGIINDLVAYAGKKGSKLKDAASTLAVLKDACNNVHAIHRYIASSVKGFPF